MLGLKKGRAAFLMSLPRSNHRRFVVRMKHTPPPLHVRWYVINRIAENVGPLLVDDAEWVEWGDGVPPSGVITRGKEAFIQNYGDNKLRSEVHRLTEENNVVVVEGTAHVSKKDGSSLSVRYVNIFELENGKIKRKSSFGAMINEPS